MSGPARTGRLDRWGPVGARVRDLAGVTRTATGMVSRRVRRTLREPAALREAERSRLVRLARSAASGPGAGAVAGAATPALDAAVTAWLADPGPLTGALLRDAQGRYRTTAESADPPPAGSPLDGIPLDEAQRLSVLLSSLRSARTGPDAS